MTGCVVKGWDCDFGWQPHEKGRGENCTYDIVLMKGSMAYVNSRNRDNDEFTFCWLKHQLLQYFRLGLQAAAKRLL